MDQELARLALGETVRSRINTAKSSSYLRRGAVNQVRMQADHALDRDKDALSYCIAQSTPEEM